MIRSLKRKFVLVNMTIVTCMLLVIFGMVLHTTRRSMEEQSMRAMRALLDSERSHMARPGDGAPGLQLPYFLASLDGEGEIVSLRSGYFDLSDEDRIAQILALARESGAESGVLRSYNLRYMRRNTPFGQALVFVDMSSERTTIRELLENCVLIGAASLTAFYAISLLLARWAIRPVERAWNQQRQFVADASHELKTPLTVIMTNAELLAAPNYDEDQRRTFAASILTMSRQMRGLVESLLELARVENGGSAMAFAPVDLSELAAEALLPFEPVFFERDLRLDSAIDRGLWVSGSVQRLKQVVDILLDNAAKYSDRAGAVTLELKRQGVHCLLAVSNPGQPISREDLKNIFRRFYRMDKARAMDHSYGLGLAIAESIVAAHRGKIWAESAGGVNTFLVQLPLLPHRAVPEGLPEGGA